MGEEWAANGQEEEGEGVPRTQGSRWVPQEGKRARLSNRAVAPTAVPPVLARVVSPKDLALLVLVVAPTAGEVASPVLWVVSLGL